MVPILYANHPQLLGFPPLPYNSCSVTGYSVISCVNCFYGPCCYGPWNTLPCSLHIKYLRLKLGFLKVPKAGTTTQVVVKAVFVSEFSHFLYSLLYQMSGAERARLNLHIKIESGAKSYIFLIRCQGSGAESREETWVNAN
jgi:hypothetical protein